jgi:hypothetical protein
MGPVVPLIFSNGMHWAFALLYSFS